MGNALISEAHFFFRFQSHNTFGDCRDFCSLSFKNIWLCSDNKIGNAVKYEKEYCIHCSIFFLKKVAESCENFEIKMLTTKKTNIKIHRRSTASMEIFSGKHTHFISISSIKFLFYLILITNFNHSFLKLK